MEGPWLMGSPPLRLPPSVVGSLPSKSQTFFAAQSLKLPGCLPPLDPTSLVAGELKTLQTAAQQ